MDITNMSDFQISLIIIGIVIIVGVAVFNWYQQMNYRKKVESTFEHEHDDVLLDHDEPPAAGTTTSQSNERIEPQLNKKIMAEYQANTTDTTEPVLSTEIKSDNIAPITPPASTEAEAEPEAESSEAQQPQQTDHEVINYVALIEAESPIPAAQLNALVQRKYDFDKAVSWYGQAQDQNTWSEIADGHAHADNLTALKGCLQLADRSGPISEVNLSKFRDIIEDFAAQINAKSDCPDISQAYEQAIQLDQFCADVDIMLGITIISKDDGAFVGTKIRALAEAYGFKLDSDGLFKYWDESDTELFTLSNSEDTPFLADNIKTLSTHGVTFLIDIPRVADGEKAFDQLIHLAKIFSNTLGGILVDDNRVPLNDSGIAKSRQFLMNIQTAMQKSEIPAGGKSALQLFL